jgi:two-component system NtrC family sensor kinase
MPVPGTTPSLHGTKALSDAVERSPIGLAVVARDGTCLYVNDAMARLLGRDAPALVDAPCLLTAGRGADVLEFEHEVERPDGSRAWLLVTIGDGDGELVVQAHDITARKDEELRLREREALYRTAFDHANVGIGVLDEKSRFVLVNDRLAQAHRMTPDEIVGLHPKDLSPPDVREELYRDAEANVRDPNVDSLELELPAYRADGTDGWVKVNVTFVRNETGRAESFVSVTQDVTRRRLAEGALRESEQRYRSLVERLPMTIYSARLERPTEPMYVSPGIESLVGYTVDEWMADATMFARSLHPEDRERVLAAHRAPMNTGDEIELEYRLIARDGRVVHVYQEGLIVADDHGRPAYHHGFALDVTEHRQLEEQLRLAQKLESVGQLAAGIAHEINTPVQFVSDSVKFLQDGCTDLLDLVDAYETAGPTPEPEALARLEDARDYADLPYLRERLPAAFERTVNGLKRVTDIVRAMRDFAHPGRGGQTPVDLNEAVRNTLVVANSQIKYVADLDVDLGDIPTIMADGGELNQVLVNLIVNAAHAVSDVVADTEERGVIRVATRSEGDEVVLTIGDTGTGISEENRKRIFDPFFTTKAVGKGTGQGLALVRTVICEHHNGSISVDSELGVGTIFEIRLPVAGVATDGTDAE